MAAEDEPGKSRRKRRTRTHVIADLSENHLERKVLLQGHWLRRPERDYGVDVTMFHFSPEGRLENGEVRFQLKATEGLQVVEQGTKVSIPIKSGDLHYWALETYPFVLIVFDVAKDEAYWINVQDYVDQHPDVVDLERGTVNVRIPVSNCLTEDSIASFRDMSLKVVDQLRNTGGDEDATRKPK